MIQNKEYFLYKTHETSYLLPTGQARYSGKKQLKLNKLGAFIWTLLYTEKTLDEIIASSMQEFLVKEYEKDSFIKEIYSFIGYCLKEAVLLNPSELPPIQNSKYMEKLPMTELLSPLDYIHCTKTSIPSRKETLFFEIANLTCSYIGDESCFPKDFANFMINKTDLKTDLTYYIGFINEATTDPTDANNQFSAYLKSNFPIESCKSSAIPLISTNEVIYYDTGLDLIIKPLQLEGILETRLSYDGHTAFILCDSAYRSDFQNKDYKEGNPLFLAMRYPFLYAIEKRGMLALHSSSIVYENKVWLFSALSGTGKTTHTNLWREHFHTPVFNGDLCVIGVCNNQAYAYGIPWCGTSKDALNCELPLGGIILLNRDTTNYVLEIPTESQAVALFNRLLTTSHTATDTLKTLDCLSTLLDTGIFTRMLYCNISVDAAIVMKTSIDSFLQDEQI